MNNYYKKHETFMDFLNETTTATGTLKKDNQCIY